MTPMTVTGRFSTPPLFCGFRNGDDGENPVFSSQSFFTVITVMTVI
jgi:hypothetical protein